MDEKPTFSASVKVMRSHDYCHFEVALGSNVPLDTAGVDAMRKEAARLADKAVEQYKIAKLEAEKRQSEKYDRAALVRRIQRIRDTPEGDRTVSSQAELKAFDDTAWHVRRRYDYEDDWQDYDDEH